MDYEIKNEKPPIWEEAHKHFKIDDGKTFYTYGRCIYNPAGLKLPDHIVAHEKVHMAQQEAIGGPDIWWEKYFADPEFRMHEELEAYREQYRFYKNIHQNRRKREIFLEEIAKHLSSGMYGLGIEQGEAEDMISNNNY